MTDNKWQGGRTEWHIAAKALPPGLLAQRGITFWSFELTPSAGPEVVVLLVQDESTCAELEGIDLLRMNLYSGICPTSFGPIFWILFRLSDPALPGDFISYEYPVNLGDDHILTALGDLSNQPYWHFFLLDPQGRVRNFVEFRNGFGLGDRLQSSLDYLATHPLHDFAAARAEYEETFSLPELIAVAEAQG